jgi:ATP-dependent DNA helicase PIF1
MIKKIPVANASQRFQELLKKFEYVEQENEVRRTELLEDPNIKKITIDDFIVTGAVADHKSTKEESLSKEQQIAYEKFILGDNLFITGPGGTGKTHLIKILVDTALKNNKRIQVCALTGCAAVLLQCNARTIHSWSGIKLAKGPVEKIIANVYKNRQAMKAWKTTQVLIIDEVSMMSQKIFDVLNKLGQTIRNNNRPFGGIQVIFCGDFFQLGPIGEPEDHESGLFCFESPNWFSVFTKKNHIELKTIFRQRDPIYIQILSEVRCGELSHENIEILKKYVKREYNPAENNDCILTKLFPIRNRAEYINKMMFDQIDKPTCISHIKKNTNCQTYLDSGKAIENMVLEKCDRLTTIERERELEQLMTNNNMPSILEMKIGAAVMCTANLDLDKGICNGSQGVIIDIIGEDCLPKVKFANGVVFTLPTHFVQSEEYPSIAIGQIPLILAWALTIHKIQGATLAMGQMDIGQSIFEYGQTYVALSRIQSLNGLYLSNFEPSKIRANPKVKEFYKHIV